MPDDAFAIVAAGWPRLCRGEASSSFWSSTSSCENEPFDFRRYSSARRALDAYAAFHAAFNASPDARYLVFAPNQYGLGNRLRAMKSALLVAMLTGRVFRVRWEDPWPLADFVQHERIDWRLPDGGGDDDEDSSLLCLPFGPDGGAAKGCTPHLRALQTADLNAQYPARTLEVRVFTDLYIYLQANPHYASALAAFEVECPNRMGCVLPYLFRPQPALRAQLDELLPRPGYFAVQVRNRLWRQEAIKLRASNAASRVVGCLGRWVPPDADVFFTADEDELYPHARELWGERLTEQSGGVYAPWAAGTAVTADSLGDGEREAVRKAFVDWFAIQGAGFIVYTTGSSFGKTAAEASAAPNVDVGHARCTLAEQSAPAPEEIAADFTRAVSYEANVPR